MPPDGFNYSNLPLATDQPTGAPGAYDHLPMATEQPTGGGGAYDHLPMATDKPTGASLADTVAPQTQDDLGLPGVSAPVPSGAPDLTPPPVPVTPAPAPVPEPSQADLGLPGVTGPLAGTPPTMTVTAPAPSPIQVQVPPSGAPGDAVPGLAAVPQQPLADIFSQPTLADVPGATSFTPQVDPRVGFFGGVGLGAQRAMEEGRRLGRGGQFSEEPAPALPEMTLPGQLGYSLAHGSPTTAAAILGGLAGAAGGSAVPGVGTAIGGAGGAALAGGAMSAAQALVPAFDTAVRDLHMTREQAADYAIKTALVSGTFGTLTSALFALGPFRSAVTNALLHIAVTAPVTSAEQSVAQAVATDQPVPGPAELAQTAAESSVAAGLTHLGITGGQRLLSRLGQPGTKPIDLQSVPQMLRGPEEPGGGGPAPEQKQLPAPTKLLPAPDDQTAPGPSPEPDKAGGTPGPTTPIVPVPSPDGGSPGTQPVGGAPLPETGQGQTGGGETGLTGGQGQQDGQGTGQGQQGQQGQGTSITPVEGDKGGGLVPKPDTAVTPREGAPNSTRVVETNVPGVTLPVRYRVMEARDIVPATGDLQPRDRANRQASDIQIAENAARLDPFRLLGFPTAEHGAPVVALDGTVLAGNGRLAAINRAAEQHPEKYAAYKQALTDLGHDLSGFDRPVLVRQAENYLDRPQMRQFAEASNVPAGMAMSPVEQAKVDARNLSPATLDKYDPGKSLTSPSNQAFIRDWMQSIPATEHGRLQQQNGQLSQEGERRLQGAVLAKAYEHDPLLTRALESPVDDVKSVTGSLMDVAAPYVKLKNEIGQDRLPKELDITHNIAQALDLVNQARTKGIQPGDIIKQGDMFSGPRLDPVTEEIIKTIYNDPMTRLRSRKAITDTLRDYVDQALDFQPGKDLLGDERKADPAQMLRDARGGGQAALISATAQDQETGQGVLTDQPQPAAETIENPYKHYAALARRINGGTANEAARAGKKPADGTLLWFLDGDKATYLNAPTMQDAAYRGDELSKYQALTWSDAEGNQSRVWFKPGQRAQAEKVRAADQMPSSPERHRQLGLSLGYSPEDVESYMTARFPDEPKPADTVKADTTPADTGTDEEPAPEDDEFNEIDKLSPEELFGDDLAGETDIAPIDTTKARNPIEQPRLDQINKQLAAAQTKLAGLHSANRGQAVITNQEAQIEKLTRTRDAMLPQAVQARLRPGQFRAKPSRAPAMPHRPKPPGAPPNWTDYQFRSNPTVNIWQQAFTDAGEDPNLATSRSLVWQVNVLTRQMRKHFGLKDMTVDPKMDRLQARDLLLEVYRAGTDGMASLGYPTQGLGVFGTVSLNLMPYDPKGKFAGQYRFSDKTIDLVGTANSLGHEWVHAMDHWLLDQLYPGGRTQPFPLASTEAASMGGDPNDDIATRFGRVLQTLFYDDAALAARVARLQQQAQMIGPGARAAQAELDQLQTGARDPIIRQSRFQQVTNAFDQALGGNPYYGTVYEMIARTGEAFISREMEESGVDPRGFVMEQRGYLEDNVQGLNKIFPKEPERTAIYNAWKHLHEGIRNTYHNGTPAGLFADPNQKIDLHKLELNPRVPPGIVNSFRRMLAESVANLKEWDVSLNLMRTFDPTRPKATYGALQRTSRLIHKVLTGSDEQLRILDIMLGTHAPGARAPLLQIRQMLTTSPGHRLAHPTRTFEEYFIRKTREWSHIYVHILEENQLTPRDFARSRVRNKVDYNEMIHHGMTTVLGDPYTFNGDPVPDNVRKAIGQLRQLMDLVFKTLRDKGLDIQYTENGHFPRVYDHIRIWEDTEGFKRDAAKLFKRMFDDDVGAPGDNPDKLLERWRKLSMDQRALADQSTQNWMVQLAKILRKLKAIPARERRLIERLTIGVGANGQPLTPKQIASLQRRLNDLSALEAQLRQDAEDLARMLHDDVGNHIAKLGAEEWAHRVNVGYQTDFDTIGPNGSFLNHRKLPGYADDFMRKWLITDVNTALLRYFQAAARKLAFHEVMGPNQDKFEALLDQMYEQGARGEDLRWIRDIADKVTGRGNYRNARSIGKAVSYAKAFAAMTMLGASATSMMGEPMIGTLALGSGGMRLGGLRVGLRNYANQFAAQFDTMDAQERAELADMTGVTTHSVYDDVLLMREGSDYSDSPRLMAGMGTLYRAIGMTAYNNSNRRAAFGTGNWFLTHQANNWLAGTQYTGPKKGLAWRKIDKRLRIATGWLNELGVPTDPALRAGFATWMVSHDGIPLQTMPLAAYPGIGHNQPPPGMQMVQAVARTDKIKGRLPKAQELQKSDWRSTYELAMNRLVDRMVQNPKRSDVPDWGPLGSAIIQFQSFGFSMQKNVLDPALERIGRWYKDRVEQARIAGETGPMVQLAAIGMAASQAATFAGQATAVMTASIPGVLLRQRIYHPDVFFRELKNGTIEAHIFDLALNQSGLNGSLSLPLQALSQIRYDSSGLGSIFEGPGVARATQCMTDVIQAATGGGDPTTNTKIYKGLRASYNCLLVPLEAYAVMKVAGAFGPVGTLAAGVAYSFGSSSPAADWFATHITGPKGTSRPQPGAGDDELKSDLDPAEESGVQSDLEEGTPKPGAPQQQHGFTSMVPWGVMDDVAIPVARALIPQIKYLPKPAQIAAGVGVATWIGYWFIHDVTGPFRNEGIPPSQTGPPQ